MKNRKVKQMLAGSMAVVVGTGLLGTCAYETSLQADAQEVDTQELKEAAEQVLGDSTVIEEGKVYKDESVYVKADADGMVKETTVTEWLKNPGTGAVEDVTALQDIENVKGEETYTQNGADEMSWKSEGKDIYYQGTTDQKLPVNVKITYQLDGKEISPKELKGKNGKLQMTIQYENQSKEMVDVSGEQVEMYTPFTMVTAMMLPGDEYTNVTIDNGRILSDGDKNIVVGLGFPGLEENLNLSSEELDIEIPDSITITADVKNASVGPTMTVASADVLDQVGLDGIDSFDGLSDSVDELENAAQQLTEGSAKAADGSSALADGSRTLADGSKTLADGSSALKTGVGALAEGVNTLNSKSGELTQGVNDLAEGVNAYTGGVSSLASGSSQVKDGVNALTAGIEQEQAGLAALAEGAGKLNAGYQGDGTAQNPGANTLAAGTVQAIGSTSKAIDTLASLLAQMTENQASIQANAVVQGEDAAAQAAADQLIASGIISQEQREAAVSAIGSAMAENISAMAEVTKGAGSVDPTDAITAAKTAVGTANTYASGLQQTVTALSAGTENLIQTGITPLQEGNTKLLNEGAIPLQKGASDLANGAENLNSQSSLLITGSSKLQEGGTQLAGGVKQLAVGAQTAAKGAGDLASGASALNTGADTLASGAGELASGNQTLAEGMSEFKTSGIDKIAEVFGGDITKVTSRIDAMTTLGRNYKSFAGIKDDMDGSTKFIIETEGITNKK